MEPGPWEGQQGDSGRILEVFSRGNGLPQGFVFFELVDDGLDAGSKHYHSKEETKGSTCSDQIDHANLSGVNLGVGRNTHEAGLPQAFIFRT